MVNIAIVSGKYNFYNNYKFNLKTVEIQIFLIMIIYYSKPYILDKKLLNKN